MSNCSSMSEVIDSRPLILQLDKKESRSFMKIENKKGINFPPVVHH